MKRLRSMFIPMLMLITSALPAATPTPADAVYVHGRIYTGDAAQPWAEALAVRGDRVVAIGSDTELQAGVRAARRIDLRGRLVIPGINDAHDHAGMAPYGVEAHTRVPPMDDPELDDIAMAIGKAATQARPGAWIHLMSGFKAMADPVATRAAIAPVAGDHPVLIKSWWGTASSSMTARSRCWALATRARIRPAVTTNAMRLAT